MQVHVPAVGLSQRKWLQAASKVSVHASVCARRRAGGSRRTHPKKVSSHADVCARRRALIAGVTFIPIY